MSHHSPGYSITVRLRYPDHPGYLGRISSSIGDADGLIGAVDMIDARNNRITRNFTINSLSTFGMAKTSWPCCGRFLRSRSSTSRTACS